MRDGETNWRRLAITGGLIGVLAIGSAAAGATMIPLLSKSAPTSADSPAPPVIEQPSATPAETASPDVTPTPTGSPRPASAFNQWAAPLAGKLDVPLVALESYGYAEWVLQQTRPNCKLGWTTLAAIGKATTDHGRQAPSTLDGAGKSRPPLVGPALNGAGGMVRVNDSDGGALDGDRVWDHTVGPMRFLPGLWRTARVDADGDLFADVQDIDDAALAAGYFLCAGGKDLTVAANWKAALTSYGLSLQLDQVFQEAQNYGVKSRG